jgi:poly-gamma-glutamate synthesis protein (capsule biosynthesis protein)
MSTEAPGNLLAERIYVPVTRFGSLEEDKAAADLLALWLGTPAEGQQLLAVDADSAAALTLLWGPSTQAEVFPDSASLAAALETSPDRLGVLPFDRLAPAVKVLAMNGQDPSNNDFDPAKYPLTLRFYLNSRPGFEQQSESLKSHITDSALQTNRDPNKLTVLVMTGVTAMARTTALRMEQKGYEYPAKVIGPILSKADLTHISNEVPFYPECQVDASENNLTLCSKPDYMESLRAVGVDLVGLTGNHMNDFGKDANLWSMQFYEDQGIPTYGGGPNLEESLKPLLIEHNSNRLALLGANSFGPEFAWAAEDWPGSAPYSLPAMTQAISDARTSLDADVVLVELQWEESYDTLPILSQIEGFRALSDAGADIVTGVQSHVPQAVEYRNGKEILYGLGNLFFDQMWSQETREGLIARQTIYDGRHLSTKLLTTVLEDFAQPRWATDAEREAILQRVYTASGW